MSFFSGKKLLLVGFFVVLLIAIPVTVYLVGQQQKTKSSAEAATTMTIQASKTTVSVGEPISFDVTIDPSSVNQIGFVKIVLTYDPTKLATTPATFVPADWPAKDGTTFTPQIPLGPTYGNGTISVSMSVGGSPQNVLTSKTKIATFTFNALSATDADSPTQVKIVGDQTQVLSTVDEGGTSVLSNIPPPANLTITDSGSPTLTGSNFHWDTADFSLDAKGAYILIGDQQYLLDMQDSKLTTDPRNLTSDGFYNSNMDFSWTENGNPMRIVLLVKYADQGNWKLSSVKTYDGKSDGKWIVYDTSDQAGHAIASGAGNNYNGTNIDLASNSQSQVQTKSKIHMDSLTLTNLVAFLKTLSPIANAAGTTTPVPTIAPGLSCTSLSLDPGSSGTAPFAVNLTAAGTSNNGNITKVSFSFGDGQTQDVTDAGGIGTTSVSVLASHTYQTSGSFNASATLTDENGNTSSGGCVTTVSVNDASGSATATEAISPSPLPPTGPTGLVTVGALGVLLTFIGAVLLLAL